MASTTARVTDDFVDAVLTASRALVAVSARSIAEVSDAVTVVQFRTLVVLRTRPDINLNGLADTLDVNASTALRMVDRLVAADLVGRDTNPANRREVQLKLTARGMRIVDRVTARRRADIADIVRAMPARRRAELIAALQAFAAAAGEPAVGGDAAIGW